MDLIIGAILAFMTVFFGIAILGAIIAGFFIWIGAKLAGIRNSSFIRAVLAGVACSMALWLITAAFSVVPVAGSLLGFLVGLAVCVWLLKIIFETTTGKAFVAWIMHFVAQILAIIIGVATFAAGALSLLTL